LFWRSFTHWLGGMGILVLTLAVLPALGVGGFQIFKAETPGPVADKLAPKMKNTAAILYTAYLGITLLETVLLMFGGLSLMKPWSIPSALWAPGAFQR
jgi:trk system potassium uptake protein